MQIDPDNNEQVISYASRPLTDEEKSTLHAIITVFIY